MSEVVIFLAILNALVMFAYIHGYLLLRDINNRTETILNGVSHVWGAVMELKLDMKILEEE